MKWIQFNKYEKSGIIFFISILIVFVYFDSGKMTTKPELLKFIQDTQTVRKVDEFSVQITDNIKLESKPHPKSSEKRNLLSLVKFDPNTIEKEELEKMGLPVKVMNNLLKYRSKGGKFYKPEDVKRIYGLNPDLYEKLSDYIQIAKQREAEKVRYEYAEKQVEQEEKHEVPAMKIMVNTASQTDWKSLNGIGEVLSERIIKYRTALGGFTNLDQIQEVYGIQAELYASLLPKLLLDSISTEKIDINTISFKELIKHPYADYEMTRLILNYRQQHGLIRHREDLMNIYMLDSVKMNSILPYLHFEKAEIQQN
jgi:competence protein ComEA